MIFLTSFLQMMFPYTRGPFYEARAACSNVEVRHFDLLPEKGWEVDLESVKALVDDNTIAIVIINPGNPCRNVFTSEHLQEVGVKLYTTVYSHLCFGSKPFVPMGVFGSITPILTLGSISKRWIIPGWRLGWIAMVDPSSVLKKSGIAECLQSYLEYSANPATIVQGAVPHILEKMTKEFFSNINNVLKEAVDAFHTKVQEIPCFTCPYKPDGAMSVMIKLNLSFLEGINDDMDFCTKLAHEESVIILPGMIVGLKNWLRLTFAVEPAILEGLERIKAFA
ncbi:hypothetical protein K7X08_016294 [Anisodus acutangulus]|uniref:Aminotransferase class I/classII large domain-containing protein n=1 Tax=Anisodus acutangulus TaxID=402998 RepID=A0A9Q1LDW8_9SOLA|nr:hypothetical protein K7X08_016294 [Anisodus acutangulus]